MSKIYLVILTAIFLIPLSAQGVIGPEPSSGAARDFNAPEIPTEVKLTSDGSKIEITWIDPAEADFYFIEILRNDGNGTAVTGDVRVRIGKGVQRYEDREVSAGQHYRYRLRTGDTSLNTRLSDEYEVIVRAATIAPAEATPAPAVVIAPAPEAQTPAVSALIYTTPTASGVGEELRSGTYVYGFSRVRTLATEQELSKSLSQGLDERLPGVFNRLFHQKTGASKQWWYVYVNAYIYGGYTLDEIKQSVRFGGKTVHPTIPASVWRNSSDYQAYINR